MRSTLAQYEVKFPRRYTDLKQALVLIFVKQASVRLSTMLDPTNWIAEACQKMTNAGALPLPLEQALSPVGTVRSEASGGLSYTAIAAATERHPASVIGYY